MTTNWQTNKKWRWMDKSVEYYIYRPFSFLYSGAGICFFPYFILSVCLFIYINFKFSLKWLHWHGNQSFVLPTQVSLYLYLLVCFFPIFFFLLDPVLSFLWKSFILLPPAYLSSSDMFSIHWLCVCLFLLVWCEWIANTEIWEHTLCRCGQFIIVALYT